MVERMIGFKCRDCGRMTYQTRARCPNCKGKNFEEVELGDECKLLTYTKLYVLPEGVETSSLLLGMVEFPNGVRASGQLIGDHIKVGMKLRPRWGKLRKLGGKDIYGFKFEPIGE